MHWVSGRQLKQEPAPRPEVPSTAPSRAEEVIQALGDPGTSSEAVAALLQEAFDLFLVRIEVKDGPGAVGLARAMHGRAPAPSDRAAGLRPS